MTPTADGTRLLRWPSPRPAHQDRKQRGSELAWSREEPGEIVGDSESQRVSLLLWILQRNAGDVAVMHHA
jgi:hypothetical protein